MNFNKALVVGRVGKDPELKALPSGATVATFSLATSRVWVKDGQKNEETEWHNIVLWGKLADIASQYVRKGTLLLVEGHLATRSWDDNDTGKKMYRTEIVGDSIQLPPKSTSGSEGGQSPRPTQEEVDRMYDGEDAPPKESNARQHIAKSRAKVGAPEFPEEEINPEDIPF